MSADEVQRDDLLHRLLGGTLYTGFGTGLRTIASIASAKIMATYLPSHDFGTTVLIELVATFLRMVSGLSIGIAAIRLLTQKDEAEHAAIVDTVVIFRFLTFVLVSLAFLGTRGWVYRLFGEGDGAARTEGLTPLILAFTLVLAYQMVLKQLLQGLFRFKQMAAIDVLGGVLTVALLAVFLIWRQAGLVGAVMARIIGTGVTALLFYRALPTRKGLTFRRDLLREMLSFSWPLQLNEIITFTYRSFGTVVVATTLTPAAVAILAVAGKIPTNFRRLYDAFRSVYFPNLSGLVARQDYRRAQRMLNATLRAVAFLMTLATVLAFVFQRELILLFYSEQYLSAGPLFVLLMLATTIDVVIFVLGNSTVAAGNSKAPPVVNVLNTILTVIGNLTLVPPLGVIGAVLTRIVTRVLTFPVNVWFLRRTGLYPRVLDCVKPLALFGVLYGVALWIQPGSWLGRLPFLALFVAASPLFSIVTAADVRMVWRSLARLRRGRAGNGG